MEGKDTHMHLSFTPYTLTRSVEEIELLLNYFFF